MGTNCAPLLADLFLYLYEAEFVQNCYVIITRYEAIYLQKKLMLQGCNESRLRSSFRKFYGRYNDVV
jgi:hypothetical protein